MSSRQPRDPLKALLDNTEHHVFCRIGVSRVIKDQVGVLAIRDIPKGTDPFRTVTPHNHDIVWVPVDSLQKLKNREAVNLVNDFYTGDKDSQMYPMNRNGINALDISFYMNHSDKPNVVRNDKSNTDYISFRTIENIKKGEELLYCYQGDGIGSNF